MSCHQSSRYSKRQVETNLRETSTSHALRTWRAVPSSRHRILVFRLSKIGPSHPVLLCNQFLLERPLPIGRVDKKTYWTKYQLANKLRTRKRQRGSEPFAMIPMTRVVLYLSPNTAGPKLQRSSRPLANVVDCPSLGRRMCSRNMLTRQTQYLRILMAFQACRLGVAIVHILCVHQDTIMTMELLRDPAQTRSILTDRHIFQCRSLFRLLTHSGQRLQCSCLAGTLVINPL